MRVIDFGTAVKLPSGSRLSEVIGTPYYVAPEVTDGHANVHFEFPGHERLDS